MTGVRRAHSVSALLLVAVVVVGVTRSEQDAELAALPRSLCADSLCSIFSPDPLWWVYPKCDGTNSLYSTSSTTRQRLSYRPEIQNLHPEP